MPFIIQRKCKCCNDKLHHCNKCWNQFHNGQKHKDYIQPEYYGQSMMDDELIKIMKNKHGIEHCPSICPNKNRQYKEGEYH